MRLPVRSLVLAFACSTLLSATTARADEIDVIVTTCHFANAEWGAEMIDRCIQYNREKREAVLKTYAEQHEKLLTRCRNKDELGWDWVHDCVRRDVDADAALKTLPAEQAGLLAACQREFAGLGPARVKTCVDEQAGAVAQPK